MSQIEGSEQIGQSRRAFLAETARIAGAGVVLTSPGLSKGAFRVPRSNKSGVSVSKDEPIRMGVIGVGGMGRGHCGAITNLAKQGRENVRIVAVCDVCDSHLKQAVDIVAHNQGTPPDTYREHEELLDRDDIHGVLIASPEHWHSQHAIDALLAGKDVYCEKPMTLRLHQALELREVVHAHPDRIFQVGTQMMQLPKYQEARKMIADGLIGKPVWSQTSYCRNSRDGEWNYYRIDPNWKPGVNLDWDRWLGYLGPREWDPKIYARWRRYRDFSTGIIGDLLVHQMTPLLMALGDSVGWPTRVVASGGHYIDKAMENHDQVNLTVEFEGEHTMVVAGSTANEVGLENMIRGHKGNIYLNSRHCEMRPERIFADEVDPETVECPDIGNDQDMHRLAWLRCIRTREQPTSNVDLGTKIMVIVDLATRSMWDGHAYAFDSAAMKATRI